MCQKRNQLRQLVEANVDYVVYEQLEPYTILVMYAKIDGRVYRGHGAATCGPTDEWQEGLDGLGYKAAYGRAIHSIVEQLEAEEAAQEHEAQQVASAAAFLRSKGFTTIQ